ncbi:phospholipid-transporting ATPase ABCA3-like [Epargyreus clarus]|uniref:phospholipid-transporting ATPase ABCA3-like n=1 Tax=Epargyreus clarus TaxID=520877 RepID=UPI003C2D9E0E
MDVFKVLMWKHYMVRKRRFVQTIIEFTTPISLILGLFFLRDSMRNKSTPTADFDIEAMSDMFSSPPLRILYTPDTVFTRRLMAELGETLQLRPINILDYKEKSGYGPFWNSSEVEMFYKDMRPDDAIIEFQLENANGRNSSCFPDKLTYTVWLKRPLADRSEKAQFGTYQFEMTRESLLKLQWTIDSSFLRLTTGKKIKNIIIKEIPQRRTEVTKVNRIYINTLFYLLGYTSFLSPLLPFIFLMIRLLEERSSGIQELVKMVGVTPNMLGITHYINSLPPCLIFSVGGAFLLKCTSEPMIPETSMLIIFLDFFLHYNTLIAMCFTCSYLATNAQYTASLGMFVYIGMWIPIRLFEHDGKSDLALFLLGLLPHCPVYWFVNEVNVAEVWYLKGVDFSNWGTQFALHYSGGKNGCVMVSYIMQLVQITYFYTLAWYLEKVRPGRYGIAKPWNFIFQKEYWSRNKPIPAESGQREAHDPAFEKYFETPPSNMEVGIEILHVTKIFGSGKKRFQALTDLSLNIYKGEITVLLGHNGAGKTTIISIITGMISPTSGRIYVNGLDTVTQQSQVRKHLGFCPQHNLFFPDLTVLEHFLFFSMIKGRSFKDAKISSYELLEQLDLTDKESRKTAELSGGMLRRLQLGCALCGDASVLILDEPTSGLDVEARRELWDMLLALRGDRTLVLTTHFMEEADVLGDRLAALHAGRLRCHATPMFLKRAVGSDFRLTIKPLNIKNESNITRCVLDVVPGAKLKEVSEGTLIYELPPGANMPQLFNTIEKQKTELGIESVGIGITSLEEVFLELCCDVDAASITQEDIRSRPVTYVTGCRQIMRQMCELLKRQVNYTRSRIVAYAILQVLMPYVMCTMLTQIFNNGKASIDVLTDDSAFATLKAPVATLDIVSGIDKSTRRMNTLNKLKILYPRLKFMSLDTEPLAYSINPNGIKDSKLTKHVFAIKLNNSQATVNYDPSVRLSAHVALNVLSNILAKDFTYGDNRAINTKISTDWPLEVKFHIPKDKINCSLFAIFNIFIILATCVNDVTLPCKERLTVARHTHLMTGCPPWLYWLATFLYHMAGYLLFCCGATMTAAAFFDDDKTIDDRDTLCNYWKDLFIYITESIVFIFFITFVFIGAYLIALILCGMDLYVFSYFVSFYFHERGASMLLIGFTFTFGFLSPILMMALDDLNTSGNKPMFSVIMDTFGLVIPAHMFTKTVAKMTDTSRLNSYCMNNFDKCPALPYFTDGFDTEFCCSEGSADSGPYNHFAFSDIGMGYNLIIVIFQFFIFTILLLLLEYGYFNRWWNVIGKRRKMTNPEKMCNSPEVVKEKAYVGNTIKLDKKQITDTMLASNVWKTYFRLFGRPTFALRDLNFSVKKGECFGLLGVNGAGKTTTFKVAVCAESTTQGSLYVNGHFTGSEQYIRSLGYCPQFYGLDDFRSGANNLRMLLVLRGFSDEDVKRETNSWLNVVGMSRHAGRAVSGYSGGMARRLATAAALCGGAPLALLDEPTAGVDTAARRLLWAAVRRGLQDQRSIMLASNCMDEMEMLCQRVTILKEGEMCVLGTPLALRDEYAPGHSILLKLRVNAVHNRTGFERVESLKQSMQQNFNCSLKDEHLTSLHYQVHEKLLYSLIFEKMGQLSHDYSDLIEDYSVTDTTLEDVFLYINET